MEQLAKKLMNWASILEDGAREQALRTAGLPFIHPWVALMPDAHQERAPPSVPSFRHSVP